VAKTEEQTSSGLKNKTKKKLKKIKIWEGGGSKPWPPTHKAKC